MRAFVIFYDEKKSQNGINYGMNIGVPESRHKCQICTHLKVGLSLDF
jgi:hypothetical protein